jgi:hypothetical protein
MYGSTFNLSVEYTATIKSLNATLTGDCIIPYDGDDIKNMILINSR